MSPINSKTQFRYVENSIFLKWMALKRFSRKSFLNWCERAGSILLSGTMMCGPSVASAGPANVQSQPPGQFGNFCSKPYYVIPELLSFVLFKYSFLLWCQSIVNCHKKRLLLKGGGNCLEMFYEIKDISQQFPF